MIIFLINIPPLIEWKDIEYKEPNISPVSQLILEMSY